MEGHLRDFYPMTKEVLISLKHYLSELSLPLSDDLHEMVRVEQLECGVNVKDFLRYIGYQSFESNKFFSRQVLLGYLLRVSGQDKGDFEAEV
mmetsp:Transcript_6993/g.6143  ORF Transcript_6993/g.6143 Transcript_6993/m.6143 type:complete len:92 (+) Transcript_6993:74-349(+)